MDAEFGRAKGLSNVELGRARGLASGDDAEAFLLKAVGLHLPPPSISV